MEDRASSQAAKVLPVGNAARARRVASADQVPAGDFLGQQHAQHLGGVLPLCLGRGQHLGGSPPDVRQPHPAQQPFEAGVQRRRGRGAGGHRVTSLSPNPAQPVVP